MIRLPDAPPTYEASWGSSLVSALSQLITDLQGPRPLPRFTIATLPSAKRWANCLVYVSDGTSNQRLAVSDGAAWRYPDGALV